MVLRGRSLQECRPAKLACSRHSSLPAAQAAYFGKKAIDGPEIEYSRLRSVRPQSDERIWDANRRPTRRLCSADSIRLASDSIATVFLTSHLAASSPIRRASSLHSHLMVCERDRRCRLCRQAERPATRPLGGAFSPADGRRLSRFLCGSPDHRQDAGLDRLGQVWPGGHNGGQVGVLYLVPRGSNFGSSRETVRAGCVRLVSG
jgi:hypothetical protein